MTQDNEESVPRGVSTQDVHTEEDVSTSDVKKPRGSIRPPAELYDEFIELKRGDESVNDLLRRLIDNASGVDTLNGRIADLVSNNEHLQAANTELRETLEEEQNRYLAKFDEYVEEIGQLHARITTLESSSGAEVVPAGGQVTLDSFGIKDILEDARDMCGDDEMCGKIVGRILDTKIHFASKAVDHDHAAEQNRLDREQKELDRKLKEDTAAKDREEKEKERNNKLELNLLKKGIVRKSFLEDAAFVNISSVPKRPNKEIENRKRQARAEAEDEDDWSEPTAEEELMMHEDFEEDETDDHAE